MATSQQYNTITSQVGLHGPDHGFLSQRVNRGKIDGKIQNSGETIDPESFPAINTEMSKEGIQLKSSTRTQQSQYTSLKGFKNKNKLSNPPQLNNFTN